MGKISDSLSETGLSREGLFPVQRLCLNVEERFKSNSFDEHEPTELQAILQSQISICEDALELFGVIYTLEILLNTFCQGRTINESKIDSIASETPAAHDVDIIYFDYVTTLDILYSWAVFCINVATVREETRIKSFSVSEGEQLRIDEDSVIIGDIALCSLLRSIQTCLGRHFDNVSIMEEYMRSSDYDGCIGIDNPNSILERPTISSSVECAVHTIRELNCNHGVSAVSESLEIVDISATATGNENKKKGRRNFMMKFESSGGHDVAKLKRTLRSLLSLSLVIRGSGERIEISVEEFLCASEHETLTSIRLTTSHTQEQTQTADTDTDTFSISLSPSFSICDIVSDLYLDIRGDKRDNRERKERGARNEDENDFKFIAISLNARETAGEIIEFTEHCLSQFSQKNIYKNEKKMKNVDRDISVGKEPLLVISDRDKSCYEDEENITMTIISLCRLWNTWQEGEWNDRMSVHALLSFFNHLESKMKSKSKSKSSTGQ